MATTFTAGAAGIILGCPVAVIWMWLSARLGQISFWPSCRRLTRSLLCSVDAREFRALYGELLLLLGRYLARNLLLTAGASLPVVLFVLFAAPTAEAAGHWRAPGAAIFPIAGEQWASPSSWHSVPDAAFYAGTSLASSIGVVLLRMGSR